MNGNVRRATRLPSILGGLLVLTAACAVGPSPAATGTATGVPSSVAAQVVPTAQSSVVPAPPPAEASTAAALPDCTSGLSTREPGVLTIATAAPLKAPWFVGDDPETSDGYESQVARGVATTLGFGPQQQKWLVVEEQAALAGTATGFDVFLDQVTEEDAAGNPVDLSSGYYAITDAVVMPNLAAQSLVGEPDFAGLRVGTADAEAGQSALTDEALRTPRASPLPRRCWQRSTPVRWMPRCCRPQRHCEPPTEAPGSRLSANSRRASGSLTSSTSCWRRTRR